MPIPQITSIGTLLARLTWMLFGPLALFVLAISIGSSAAGWLTASDVAFFAVLGFMLLARWWEFRSGQGQTAAGEPMTTGDYRGYVLGLLALGLVVWAGANVIGNHWPGR